MTERERDGYGLQRDRLRGREMGIEREQQPDKMGRERERAYKKRLVERNNKIIKENKSKTDVLQDERRPGYLRLVRYCLFYFFLFTLVLEGYVVFSLNRSFFSWWWRKEGIFLRYVFLNGANIS